MNENVIVVSGAFATHTTKLYNYYVCPKNVKLKDVGYIAVNYINELKYLGKVVGEPIMCSYQDDKITGIKSLDYEIQIDLKEFKCKLVPGIFQLILLEPIIGGCRHLNLSYRGKGPFVSNIVKRKYFSDLSDFFEAHQRIA